MLSRLDSRRAPDFSRRAEQIAEDRILGGVHHRSDIEAGTILGDRIFEALEKSAAFESDLKSAAQ